MTIAEGRAFRGTDGPDAPTVAIVNATLAKRYYADRNPIGAHVRFAGSTNKPLEIVGVVADTRTEELSQSAEPEIYVPFWQSGAFSKHLVVRAAGDPTALVEPVRLAVRRVDAALPLTNIATQTEQIERRFEQERLFANAYALFGALALTLASIGLFGLMSYNVSRRTNEIGIRMALGATRQTVARMVLGESLIVVAVGVVLGLAGALAAGRFVTTILFGLEPTDVITMAAAVVLIVAVTVVAGYVPARRASRVDPMVALRQD
jgi:predicted permease